MVLCNHMFCKGKFLLLVGRRWANIRMPCELSQNGDDCHKSQSFLGVSLDLKTVLVAVNY